MGIKEAKAQNTQEEDIDEEIEHQTEQETIIINAANNSSKVEGSSIGIDVSENDGLQTGSTTIMSGADVEKILRIIKETDEEFKEKEKQILDVFFFSPSFEFIKYLFFFLLELFIGFFDNSKYFLNVCSRHDRCTACLKVHPSALTFLRM